MKIKTIKENYYRQGDLAIIPIKELPSNLKELETDIVRMGEQTGHHHKLLERETNQQFSILEDENGNRYLRIKKPTELTHQEHKTITIEKGFYIVKVEKDYDYFIREIKRVQD